MTIDTQSSNLLSLLNSNSQNNASSVLKQATEEATHSAKNYSSILTQSSDRVSISYRANKLQEIGQQFFAGNIASNDIAALTQSLYEGGFLTEEEYLTLGGETQQIPITSQAANFLNAYMGSGEKLSADDSKQMIKAITVIETMNQNPSEQQRLNEQQALEFMTRFSQEQAAKDTDDSVQEGFDMVLSVLSSLEKIRTGQVDVDALNSYQEVQSIDE